MLDRVAPLLVGVMGLAALWEVVGRTGLFGSSFPPLSSVARFVTDGNRSALLFRSLASTLSSAATGLAVGVLLALVGAAAAVLAPLAGVAVGRVSVTLHSIPLIAFGPILVATAGVESTPWIAAAIGAYYPIYVAVDSGFRSSPRGYDDLRVSMGASRTRQFRHLTLPHGIPAIVDGLRLGVPGALLGAVLGEWFGAPRGLGVVIVSSMQNYQIEQLWAAALVGAGCSIAAYAVLSPLQHVSRRRYTW